MSTKLAWFAALVAISASTLTGANTLTPKETADGWVLLYDGRSLDGWTKVGNTPWRVAGDGDMLALNGGEDGWIFHERVFTNFTLKCDFKVPAGSDSGVYLRASADGDPRATGYEVQIHNEEAKYTTGSLVGLATARPAAPEPDKWHTFEIEAVGDHITVKLDGVSVLNGKYARSQSGHIGLQYNKGNKVEFRNIRIKPH